MNQANRTAEVPRAVTTSDRCTMNSKYFRCKRCGSQKQYRATCMYCRDCMVNMFGPSFDEH